MSRPPRTLALVEAPEDTVPGEDPDRDRATLEAAEAELAELERELSRIDGTEEPAPG